ncbi:RidA family protein [Candidatus Palauibacter sp.]|uniref:RidA family protein n=1 Tax=Candidatus Palauibacter sp. TaxID=3101350 RepID=UPI003B5B418C
MDTYEVFNPPTLAEPRGWNHGLLAPAGGRVLFVAGQTAGGPDGRVESGNFVAQFEVALDRVLAVVREAGGESAHIGRMTVYVTDLVAYMDARRELAAAWRARMGRHYPAMALVEVRGLVEAGAMVEIEATAVLPEQPD